jgi:hypothetical protein
MRARSLRVDPFYDAILKFSSAKISLFRYPALHALYPLGKFNLEGLIFKVGGGWNRSEWLSSVVPNDLRDSDQGKLFPEDHLFFTVQKRTSSSLPEYRRQGFRASGYKSPRGCHRLFASIAICRPPHGQYPTPCSDA